MRTVNGTPYATFVVIDGDPAATMGTNYVYVLGTFFGTSTDVNGDDIFFYPVIMNGQRLNLAFDANNVPTGVRVYSVNPDQFAGMTYGGDYEVQAGVYTAGAPAANTVSANTVVAVSSATMGHGNDELGKALMKGFIYALSQLEELPRTILFYNGGAHLTGEGSASLEDLKDLELCYAPPFSTAKDVVNMAAMVALNILSKRFRQVHVDQVRGLVESGAYILDVREEGELKRGRIKGSHNIPLSRLRERMNEIPKDVPVYVHCRSSQRSYYAVCCLQGYGYDNVVNISGSFLGICLYEYFNDKTTGREPIVTDYNFR